MSKDDIKIVLLGNEAVGKSCLLEYYVNERFFDKIPHQNTVGAAFASKRVSSRNQEFNVGIWDTAGSERFHSLSRLYYRDAKAAVVCFDITEPATFEAAKRWINELRNHEETCKVYLCGTKKDLVDNKLKERGISLEKILQYSKANETPYKETSSKTGENICEMFQLIADECEIPSVNNNTESFFLSASSNVSSCCGNINLQF